MSDVLPCMTCGGPHDLAAEHLADALVAEADAEHRTCAGEVRDHVVRQPGVLGRPGPGLISTPSGSSATISSRVERVAAVHDRLGAELAQVLDEVVDERVVVVEDEYTSHGVRQRSGATVPVDRRSIRRGWRRSAVDPGAVEAARYRERSRGALASRSEREVPSAKA